MKKDKMIKIILVISLLGNVVLFYGILKANQIDKIATEENLMIYINHFEMMTLHMGIVLKDFDNQESAHHLASEAEFLRWFSTVPAFNYYGQKKMKDLSKHVILLATQVNEIVLEYFVFQSVESLSPVEHTRLQEIQHNYQGMTELVNRTLQEMIESGKSGSYLPRENELIELIIEMMEKNEEILAELIK